MAISSEALRDGERPIDQLLPPGQTVLTEYVPQALVDDDRSFLVNGRSPLALLRADVIDQPIIFQPEAAYDEYLQMDKTLVDAKSVPNLLKTYDALKNAAFPKYLDAAGWAIAESSLMGTQYTVDERLAGLDRAVECWARAIEIQKVLNVHGEGTFAEHTRPLRLALNIAVMPLLSDVIKGDLREPTCRAVFAECLDIAKYNDIQRCEAAIRGDTYATLEHEGFGHECNGLLAVNRWFSSTKFAIPASARADSGQYLPRQTHDLIAFHQHWGVIRNAIPIEIKGFGSKGDHKRYRALLLRSKIHLSPHGGTPEQTLAAIDAVYRGEATAEQSDTAEAVSMQVFDMIRDYCAGRRLGEVAIRDTTSFRDNIHVVQKYAGMILSQYVRELGQVS